MVLGYSFCYPGKNAAHLGGFDGNLEIQRYENVRLGAAERSSTCIAIFLTSRFPEVVCVSRGSRDS